VIGPLLSQLAEDYALYRGAESLTILRVTVMNPFSDEAEPDHLLGLTDAIREVAMSLLRAGAAPEGGYSASSPIFSAKST
jgi:hypothetical protein